MKYAIFGLLLLLFLALAPDIYPIQFFILDIPVAVQCVLLPLHKYILFERTNDELIAITKFNVLIKVSYTCFY